MLYWQRKPSLHCFGNNQKAEPLRNQFRTPASCRPNHVLSIVLVLVLTSVVQWAASTAGYADDPTTQPAKSATTPGSEKPNPITDAKPEGAPKGAVAVKSNEPESQGSKRPGTQPSGPRPGGKEIPLPKNVADMRNALLAAARSAKIEELRTPYEWNELPPAISNEKVDDPIAYWKKNSMDGQGLEVLNVINKVLSLQPAKLNVGRDVENSALYVWPYLAEMDLTKLTPKQQFELRTIVPPREARKIMDGKKWTWWRLAIGADGTWHSFMKHDR